MRLSSGLTVIMGLFLTGAACTPRPSSAQRVDSAVMTQSQMVQSNFNTVYDAVEALHGNWLLTRGTDSFASPSEVRVYLNSTLLGGVQTLREIAPNTVTYVQHFDGISATARWGLGHGAGAIFVSTHPRESDVPW